MAGLAVEALSVVVKQVVEYRRIVADERVRQEQIRAQRDVVLAQLAMRREILLNAADKVFGERREVLAAMFANLEDAVQAGNAELTGQLLGTIVTFAKQSPLGEVQALARDMASEGYTLDLS
ncbi:hypothetical protein J8J14_21075 [Roseomonas sp. SSH11]|uniref:Uncharacterized protein n=1 Tax=Pararoseomonas baculiformis TaxID=2820812 RepID=A0ABS4AJQ6_9PROT|nr:hypothetical protein [Pararoseomonas baculiformis]MBP0447269.1 hypothetical protein [Pararoseomonas baculiformis]